MKLVGGCGLQIMTRWALSFCVYKREASVIDIDPHISRHGLLRWLLQKHLTNQNAWIKNQPVWITHPLTLPNDSQHVHTNLPMRWHRHTSHLRSARWKRTSKLWKWWHLDRFRDSVKYHLDSKMLHSDCRTDLESKNGSSHFYSAETLLRWTDLPNFAERMNPMKYVRL